MLPTVYKDLQEFITILLHPNFTTCLQNDTTATKYNPPQLSGNYDMTD
jgi:hypothetical protein